MKKFIIVVCAIFATTAFAAGCRSWMVTTPDGKTLSCLECCDSGGACNVTCY